MRNSLIYLSHSSLFCLLSLPLWFTDPVAAQQLDLNTPEGVVQAQRKMQCSTRDGEHAFFSWQGYAFSRVPGERDRKLFAIEGMNVRQCGSVSDPKRGKGYQMVSREIMLYKDPETGAVLRTWMNPWTEEEIEIIHVANDPVNGRPTFGLNPDGSVATLDLVMMPADTFFWPLVIPLFYTNPLGGSYQEQVGGVYHSAEIFNFSADSEDLLDPRMRKIPTNIAWVRMAPWLPWMNMGDRPGIMYFNSVGSRVNNFAGLSQTMQQEIRRNYPKYRKPPPLTDQRRNETSWTYAKKMLDKRAKDTK